MQDREIVRRAWEEIEPDLAAFGYELVEVEFGRHGGGHLLRFFIDRAGGVTLDDCAEVSRHLGILLDKLDWIDGRYTLEVSSPGIDRPLRKPADFQRYAGEEVRLQAVSPVEGRRRFTGRLSGIEDGLVGIEVDGALFRIHLENVKKAQLVR